MSILRRRFLRTTAPQTPNVASTPLAEPAESVVALSQASASVSVSPSTEVALTSHPEAAHTPWILPQQSSNPSPKRATSWKERFRTLGKDAAATARVLLWAGERSSDALPPLKSVLSVVNAFGDIIAVSLFFYVNLFGTDSLVQTRGANAESVDELEATVKTSTLR